MTGLIEESRILLSATVFDLLRHALLVEIYEDNPVSHR